ncbi:MAG TPA: 4-hydroxy-tetrahydrodipicolinate reductase [Bacteroidales bacterium]|jgi:4-hydroxy-tetrahydrodipicolinate reductase|nr:4-hydroxy-tetrahydrodipicolinate reductase [Bacteroidales bacterium]HOS71380.1 4-hydroxy-tetrahydrodipicolinate reductase [Bacteroidales bacterium]HQH25262.1 4-hydroxy-tetrahydrodipicolinate reductase [Bacteroidales bacterium]HQJ82797.1 4-hydroxy-tetrahydrodipicolinate reductase [Bacteroidales bacterium]
MNIVLIGYGRMGHEIEEAAVKRGHTIVLAIDADNLEDLNEENMKEADVAIEFTMPEAAFGNISACLKMGVPVVSGTTGWLKDYDRARELCIENGTSFLHSSNFSIGVSLLYRLSSELAEYMKHYSEYSVSIEEIHHVKKLDAPSGTAIALAEGIAGRHPGYAAGWCPDQERKEGMIPVKSVREGLVPGTHIITWDSDIDTISLKHEAKNRKGLALGAVVAAEFISTRKGVFTMKDVLGF